MTGRWLIDIIHHRLVLMRRLCRFDVIHRTHRHRGCFLPPGSSCGARLLPPADIDDPKDDERQENESVESHNTKHDRDESVQSVQGSTRASNTIRCGTDDLWGGDVIGDVGSRLRSPEPGKIRRSFIWINQRKEFDERVAHLALAVEVSEIVDRVDATKDIVTYQPITRPGVRMQRVERVGYDVSQLTLSD